MLIASTTADDGRRVLLLGLSDENVQRLQAGMPIRLSHASHGMAVPQDLVIVLIAGETEDTMEADLRAHDLIGPTTVMNQKAPR